MVKKLDLYFEIKSNFFKPKYLKFINYRTKDLFDVKKNQRSNTPIKKGKDTTHKNQSLDSLQQLEQILWNG